MCVGWGVASNFMVWIQPRILVDHYIYTAIINVYVHAVNGTNPTQRKSNLLTNPIKAGILKTLENADKL